jgi:hypothetical protein
MLSFHHGYRQKGALKVLTKTRNSQPFLDIDHQRIGNGMQRSSVVTTTRPQQGKRARDAGMHPPDMSRVANEESADMRLVRNVATS